MNTDLNSQPLAPGETTTEGKGTLGVHVVAAIVHLLAILILVFGNKPWAVGINAFLIAAQSFLQASYNVGRSHVKAAAALGAESRPVGTYAEASSN